MSEDNGVINTEQRKLEHIKICLEEDVEFNKSSKFEEFSLDHNPIPEINFDDINMSVEFLGNKLDYPLYITAITGGTDRAAKINKNLAEAAQKLGIGMGVGSQRAMIEDPSLTYTYEVRDVAPDIFLVSNLGLPQLIDGFGKDEVIRSVNSIDADALAIHFNPLQEVIQPNGDTNFKGGLEALEDLKDLDFPIIAKETGSGFSFEKCSKLEDSGVDAINVAGAGGTSWGAVEYYRASYEKKKLAKEFWDWGIPTAYSVIECSRTELPLISSGGIRTGLEVAKSIAMGAELGGLAAPLLEPALEGSEEVVAKLQEIILELKVAMFLVGAKNINELKEVPVTIED